MGLLLSLRSQMKWAEIGSRTGELPAGCRLPLGCSQAPLEYLMLWCLLILEVGVKRGRGVHLVIG